MITLIIFYDLNRFWRSKYYGGKLGLTATPPRQK
jgi:superfamily II DNA or RNA helicase